MSKPTKEVYARYHARVHMKYTLTLRKDSDAGLIKFIEDSKAAGVSPTATLRELYRAYMAAGLDDK